MHIPAAAAVLCSATLLLTAILATNAQNTITPTLPSSSTSCDPTMCGGLHIKYPFWLNGTHRPECGYRAFQVTCNRNGTASLKNSIWTYQIREISYGDHNGTFLVANTDLSDGTCDIKLKVNASSDPGLAPFGISATNQQLYFLYNCTDLEVQPPPLAWAPVNCTNANASTFNSFALLAGSNKPDDKRETVPGSCTMSMMSMLGYPGATRADYRRLMNNGFLLEYTANDCRACEESGGFCRINTIDDIFECHCSDGVSDLIIARSSGNSSSNSIPGLKNFEFFVVQ